MLISCLFFLFHVSIAAQSREEPIAKFIVHIETTRPFLHFFCLMIELSMPNLNNIFGCRMFTVIHNFCRACLQISILVKLCSIFMHEPAHHSSLPFKLNVLVRYFQSLCAAPEKGNLKFDNDPHIGSPSEKIVHVCAGMCGFTKYSKPVAGRALKWSLCTQHWHSVCTHAGTYILTYIPLPCLFSKKIQPACNT